MQLLYNSPGGYLVTSYFPNLSFFQLSTQARFPENSGCLEWRFNFQFRVEVLGLGFRFMLRFGLRFLITCQKPCSHASLLSLPLEQFSQLCLPNGKITSAVLLPLMAK